MNILSKHIKIQIMILEEFGEQSLYCKEENQKILVGLCYYLMDEN